MGEGFNASVGDWPKSVQLGFYHLDDVEIVWDFPLDAVAQLAGLLPSAAFTGS